MTTSPAIIIPSRDHYSLLRQCLQGLARARLPPGCKIIIVENGATDLPGQRWLRRLARRQGLTVIRSAEPLGFSQNINLGIKAAPGRHLLLLNNDTIPPPDFLAPLLHELKDPRTGIVGNRLLYPNGTLQHAGVGFLETGIGHLLFNRLPGDFAPALKRRRLQAVVFACALLRNTVTEEVGPLDEAFRGGFCEDIDYCCRARRKGFHVVYAPASWMIHCEGQTYRKSPATLRQYLINERLFVSRWRHRLRADWYRICGQGLWVAGTPLTMDFPGMEAPLAATLPTSGWRRMDRLVRAWSGHQGVALDEVEPLIWNLLRLLHHRHGIELFPAAWGNNGFFRKALPRSVRARSLPVPRSRVPPAASTAELRKWELPPPAPPRRSGNPATIIVDFRDLNFAPDGTPRNGRARHNLALFRHLLHQEERFHYELLLPRPLPPGLLPPSSRITTLLARPTPGFSHDQVFLANLLPTRKARAFYSPTPRAPIFTALPSLITIYDLIPLIFNHAAYPRYRHPHDPPPVLQYARSSRQIVTPSQHSKQDLVDYLGLRPSRISVIPSGVQFFLPPRPWTEVREKYGLNAPYLLLWGYHSPHKNFSRLPAAISRLPPALRRDHHFIVLSDPPRRRLPRPFRCLTRVPDGDWMTLLEHADLFVFPSLYEGFGLPPLEAMAMGCPVVCGDHSSLREYFEGAALLVDTARPAAISQAILEVLGNADLRSRLSRLGLTRARTFSWESSARRLRDLLYRLAGE